MRVALLAPLVLAELVAGGWGVVDAAGRPAEAFDAAGHNRTLWIAAQVAGAVFCWVGLMLSLVYLTAVRPRVAAVQSG